MRDDRQGGMAALPADHAERRRAIDPEHSFIVRAPAGSGKTTLLVQRYLMLLTKVAQPEEILCMTFTRKAAGEMRTRVLAALQRAAEGQPDSGKKTDATVDALARAALAHGHKRKWNLLHTPSRLQFYTIDGLCARLVRQMPRGSGFGAAPDVEALPVVLYRRAAAGAIALMDDGDGPAACAARTVLDYLDNNHDRLQALIVEMLERRDQWLGLTVLRNDAEARDALERNWHEIVTRHVARVRDAMARDAACAGEIVACAALAARRLHDEGLDSPVAACRDLTTLPPAEADALPQWRGLAALLLTGSGTVRTERGVTKTVGFPSKSGDDKTAKRRMVEALGMVRTGGGSWADDLHAVRHLPHPRYPDERWRVLSALLMLLKQAAAQLNLDIGGLGRCDYIALATSARAALGTESDPTDLALALDHRIHHLLVDEFQDTSQSQMELLKLLTAGWDGSDARTLFLVGDPMQSIYGWRLADVRLYLQARVRGIGQLKPEPLTLTANFRSQRPLVEWVNRVFRRAMPKRSDALTGAVEFSESSASCDETGTDRGNRVGVCFHAHHNGKGGQSKEAAAFVDIVRDERANDPDATIAILARHRSHLPAILHALKDAGVPCQEVGLDPLVRRPPIRDMLALTCALLHPADRAAWLAVLRAPWCGLDLRDLDALCASDVDLWERMRDPNTLAGLSRTAQGRLARMVPVLEQALARRGRLTPARWIENTWLQLGGAALVTAEDWPNVRLYLDHLRHRCESTGLRDYGEWDACLDTLCAIDDDHDVAGNPVQVMTMHGVKGLEFDVVLLPGLGRASRSDARTLLAWSDHGEVGDGTRRILLAPLPVSEHESGGAMYEYLKAFHAHRRRLEDERLLYVACTRAKRRLHLCAGVEINEEGASESGVAVPLKPPRSGSLLSHIWDSCADDFGKALTAEGKDAAARPSVGRKEPQADNATRLWRVPDGWRPPPPMSSIPTIPARDDVPDPDDTMPTFDWAGQPARLTGVIVHRMLCLIAEQGLRVWNVERVRGCRAAWAAELEMLGLERMTSARVVGDIEAALRFSLDDPKGRWILDDHHRDARNEYDLSGVVDGHPVRVVLDRTMTDADGVRWIIDYKVGVHRGADLPVFLDNERERYRSQLEGYATLVSRMIDDPIRLGLYFPLARGWREWAWRGDGAQS